MSLATKYKTTGRVMRPETKIKQRVRKSTTEYCLGLQGMMGRPYKGGLWESIDGLMRNDSYTSEKKPRKAMLTAGHSGTCL